DIFSYWAFSSGFVVFTGAEWLDRGTSRMFGVGEAEPDPAHGTFWKSVLAAGAAGGCGFLSLQPDARAAPRIPMAMRTQRAWGGSGLGRGGQPLVRARAERHRPRARLRGVDRLGHRVRDDLVVRDLLDEQVARVLAREFDLPLGLVARDVGVDRRARDAGLR